MVYRKWAVGTMWFRNTRATLDFITSHDRSQLRVFSGLRNSLGVVLAILVGVVTGNVLAGLAIGIGGQVAGFAGLNGTSRRRFRTMLLAAFWMGITTFVGGVTGGTWETVVTVAGLGFFAGLFVCVSNEAGLVGLWATIALIFISGLHETPQRAVSQALFVLAGGILQAILMMVTEWFSPSNAETIAVVDAYVAISDYARIGSRKTDLQVASALLEADGRLRDSFLNPHRWQQLRSLLDLAESVRIEAVAINGMIRLLGHGTIDDKTYFEELRSARVHIANLLWEIANSLHRRSPLTMDWDKSAKVLFELSQNIERVTVPRDWIHAYTCIGNAYTELTQAPPLLNRMSFALGPGLPERWVRSPIQQLRSAYEAVRANLTFQSASFRHAVRLGVALGIATVTYRCLPDSHGYWIPLTTLVILKPEFTTTVSRGVARLLGTLVGSLFAAVLLTIPDPTHVLGIVLVGLFLWGMYSVLNYNMVLFSSLLTAEVVVLLSFFQNIPLLTAIVYRAIYTMVGSLLAFVAYLLWPTWQHRNVPNAIGGLLSAERQYLRSILSHNDSPTAALHRKRTRLTRTNAVNLVYQAMREPANDAWDEYAMWGLLTTLNRFSDTLLSLESYRAHENGGALGHPDIVQFGQYVENCLLEIESEVRQFERGASVKATSKVTQPDGTLDVVSPITKQQLLELDVPASLASVLNRMEANLTAMFRMVSALRKIESLARPTNVANDTSTGP